MLLQRVKEYWFPLLVLAVMAALPALVNKFYLGLLIEVFVLAVFAMMIRIELRDGGASFPDNRENRAWGVPCHP